MDHTLAVGQPRVATRRFNFEMGIGAIYGVYVYLLYFNNRKWLAWYVYGIVFLVKMEI